MLQKKKRKMKTLQLLVKQKILSAKNIINITIEK